MYVYTVYINKKMVFSSVDINKIYNYIYTQYNKSKLDTFHVEYFGNDYVTKYSNDTVEIYIIREKNGFVKDNINKLLKPPLKITKYVKLDTIENYDDIKSYTPNSKPNNYDVNTIRTGNDNKLYIINETKDGKEWKLK